MGGPDTGELAVFEVVFALLLDHRLVGSAVNEGGHIFRGPPKPERVAVRAIVEGEPAQEAGPGAELVLGCREAAVRLLRAGASANVVCSSVSAPASSGPAGFGPSRALTTPGVTRVPGTAMAAALEASSGGKHADPAGVELS